MISELTTQLRQAGVVVLKYLNNLKSKYNIKCLTLQMVKKYNKGKEVMRLLSIYLLHAFI